MSIRLAGMNSGMDTDAMVQELVKAYKAKGDKNVKNQKKAEWKQDAWKDLNKKIKSFYGKYAANMKYSSYYSKKSTSVSDPNKATIVTSDNAVNGTQTLEVKNLAKTSYLTGAKLASGTTANTTLADLGYEGGKTSITINRGAEIKDADGNGTGTYAQTPLTMDITADTKISDVVDRFKAAGYNASFDEANGRFFISSKESGAENNFTLSASDSNGNDALAKLGLAGGNSTKIDGSDAKIILNGAEFESSNNTFSINGLTITAKDVTDGELTISTDTDYDAIYNDIKSFIKDYSDLINEMDKLFNAPSAGKYEPLTDEEREVLSDSEAEKWENKVKDALLRNDENLRSVSSILKNSMLQTFDYEGKTYSLSSFGIETLSYFEAEENQRNAFHIDGNPDDDASAGKPDKLKTAIAADPAAVTNFFQKLTSNMYDQLSKFSASSANRSFGSFYDDKKMKSDYDSYASKISKWDDYVKKVEDRYYKQFTAMEKAMATLNSQQSYITGLFGGQ